MSQQLCVCRRTGKKMHMVGHHDKPAHEPAISHRRAIPDADQNRVGFVAGKQRPPVMGDNCEENRGMTGKGLEVNKVFMLRMHRADRSKKWKQRANKKTRRGRRVSNIPLERQRSLLPRLPVETPSGQPVEPRRLRPGMSPHAARRRIFSTTAGVMSPRSPSLIAPRASSWRATSAATPAGTP